MDHLASTGADRWDVVADSYGISPMIARLADGLVDAVGIASGESVVDVGTGTGLALFAAARRAPDGVAIGVDRSYQMLKVASRP